MVFCGQRNVATTNRTLVCSYQVPSSIYHSRWTPQKRAVSLEGMHYRCCLYCPVGKRELLLGANQAHTAEKETCGAYYWARARLLCTVRCGSSLLSYALKYYDTTVEQTLSKAPAELYYSAAKTKRDYYLKNGFRFFVSMVGSRLHVFLDSPNR